VYTVIERRKTNPDRMDETMRRAQSEFFPMLQQAPGFVGFYLVPNLENGITTAISVWEDKAHVDAFYPKAADWLKALDDLGNVLQSNDSGETVVALEAHK